MPSTKKATTSETTSKLMTPVLLGFVGVLLGIALMSFMVFQLGYGYVVVEPCHAVPEQVHSQGF